MESFIGNGQFNYITSPLTKTIYQTAHAAISQLKLWDFIKQDPGSGGFLMSTRPEISDIYYKIEENGYHGHSGASFAMALRSMRFLALNGEAEFMNRFLPNSNINTYPTIDKNNITMIYSNESDNKN